MRLGSKNAYQPRKTMALMQVLTKSKNGSQIIYLILVTFLSVISILLCQTVWVMKNCSSLIWVWRRSGWTTLAGWGFGAFLKQSLRLNCLVDFYTICMQFCLTCSRDTTATRIWLLWKVYLHDLSQVIKYFVLKILVTAWIKKCFVFFLKLLLERRARFRTRFIKAYIQI